MANIMTGRIHMILPTETIVSKNDKTRVFTKRTLVLDCTRYDQFTGERGYDNFPSFEFTGDKCSDLDNYQVGQIVSVSFDLQGNKFVDSNGKERWFTSIRGYKIEAKTMVQPQPKVQMQQAIQQLQNAGFVESQPKEQNVSSYDEIPF